MALQISFNSKYGTVFPEAYCRIVNFQGLVDRKTLHLGLDVYADAAAREANKEPIDRISVTIEGVEAWDAKVINSGIPIGAVSGYDVVMTNAYDLLKAEHPLFADAIDV